jgi:hypothetical protein
MLSTPHPAACYHVPCQPGATLTQSMLLLLLLTLLLLTLLLLTLLLPQ